MDTKTLFQLSAEFADIEDALWNNGGELTEELALRLQETELSLAKKADGYNALLRSFASQKEILKAEIDRLNKLKKVAENAEKRIKQHIVDTMGMFGIEKIEGDKCKMSRAKTTAVETDDEQLIAAYLQNVEELQKVLPSYITVELKVSKTAIKDMFKEQGILPAGAEFVENYSLRIR